MREKLVAYLWPDSDSERARPLLSDSIYRINQAVGGEALLAIGEELRLNTDVLRSDVVDFRDAIACRDWERAVELYTGPFLDGFYLTSADEFERWIETERDALARDRARALEALVTAAEESGDTDGAVRWARMLAAHDALSSRFALRLMSALERAGDPSAALNHARIHSQLVRNELGVAPDASIAQFEERLRRAPPSPARRPALASEPASPAVAVAAADDVDQSAQAVSTASAVVPTSSSTPDSRWFRSSRFRAVALGAAVLVVFAANRMRQAADPEPANARTAMAVLPLADLSAGRDQEYLADGITEELIVRLSSITGMQVVGRTTAFALKGSANDVREIGRQLGVSAVLSGSVRRSANRLRVVVQLMDAVSGYQLWSETYEREASDVFVVQDEIARAVVTRLRGALSVADSTRLAIAGTDDPEAYNLYLRGRFEWHKRTESGLRSAVDYFRRATERAPTYAQAHNGLADAYAVLGFYDYLPPSEAFPRAAEAAQRALALHADLASAHATLGYVALYHEWDWARAEAEFTRAIELDPSYSTGRQWYANYLTAVARFDEAVREMRAAQELDPLSQIANAALGWIHYHAGEPQRAVDQLTHMLEINPDFELAYLWRSLAREELGQYDAQLDDVERAVTLSGGSAISTAAMSRALALSGQRERARETLRALEAKSGAYLPAYDVAKAYVALGEHDTAIRWLERAYAQRSHSMVFVAVDPQLKPLRSAPAYDRLVRLMRFPARTRD